jgi:Caspase domain
MSMSGENRLPLWHVLLIGIDAYMGGAPALGGCVNDIDAIQAVLIGRLGVPLDRIRRHVAALNDGVARPTEVASKPATWYEVCNAFDEISDQVRAGDRVFIYYSGHGTQRYVKTANGQRYFREALVPYDNVVVDVQQRARREQLVFDWQVNAWLAKIAATTNLVTVILDCCCAAGATRGVGRTRFAPPPTGAADFELGAGEAMSAQARGVALGAGRVDRCMVVAACLDDEVARESEAAEGTGAPAHGELTRALLAQLTVPERDLAALSWSAIWRPVVDGVKTRNPYQTPWVSSHLGRLVFCGPPTEGDLGYSVQRCEHGFRVDAGSLSGVTNNGLVAVYPPLSQLPRFPPIGDDADRAARVGLLRVITADRSTAMAEAVSGAAPPDPLEPGARGRLVGAGKEARLRVSLSPNDPALAKRIASSRLLEVVPDGAHLTLIGTDDGGRELTDDVFGPDPERDHYVLYRIPASMLAVPPPAIGRDPIIAPLEQYFDYSAPLRLAKACTDLPRSLRLRLLDCSRVSWPIPADQAENTVLEELQPDRAPNYHLRGRRLGAGEPPPPSVDVFTIEVENVSDRDLYVTVFFCENSGKVTIYASRVATAAHSRARVWVGMTKGVPLSTFVDVGSDRIADRIVVIGTTNGAAILDHLKTSNEFRNAVRTARVRGDMPGPDLWTAAVAVLRSRI